MLLPGVVTVQLMLFRGCIGFPTLLVHTQTISITNFFVANSQYVGAIQNDAFIRVVGYSQSGRLEGSESLRGGDTNEDSDRNLLIYCISFTVTQYNE